MDNFLDFIKRQQELVDSFQPSKLNLYQHSNPIGDSITAITEAFTPFIDLQEKLSSLFDSIGMASVEINRKFTHLFEAIENNPEVQFASAAELEILALSQDELPKKKQYELLKYKEVIVEKNLSNLISEQNILDAWKGSGHALRSRKAKNPDKARHMLVSLRAMLEHFIEDRLATDEELKKLPEFKKYFKGRPNVPRALRIKHFTNKFEFGMMDEFKPEDIEFIVKCYKKLCNLHNAEIELTQLELRIIRMKSGVIIWLLAYLDNILTSNID